MSAAEVAWRMGHKLRTLTDRAMLRRRQAPIALYRIVRNADDEASWIAGGLLRPRIEPAPGSRRDGYDRAWLRALQTQADRAREHRLALFDVDDVFLGDPVNWNREPKADVNCPTTIASSIDYRDYRVTGDCKWVWEPNRHHQLVVLGRAYAATGDERYAESVVEQIDSWIEQCPYGMGMNWRSPLELGIRIINWAYAIDLIRESSAFRAGVLGRWLTVIYRQAWDIQRQYSRFSSANNHLIGEAAGVFIASSFFHGLRQAGAWRDAAQAILQREIIAQTRADGGTREQASGYHLFVLEFFTLAAVVARRSGCDFDRTYYERLARMFEFTTALVEGGRLPMIGDADDGYVLDLGGRADRVGSLMTIGAGLFGRSDWSAGSNDGAEPAWWLGVDAHCGSVVDEGAEPTSSSLQARSLPESGYYLLQRGRRGASDAVSVMVDCGELGYGSIAAHGHADALSLSLRVGGVDVLVDPGTYDYFTFGEWREYFRSTRAHNTMTVDEQDQTKLLGSFLWGTPARAKCLEWKPTGCGGLFVGEHDGYTRLADPVIHRRTVILHDDRPMITIRDEFTGKRTHAVTGYWHFAEQCRLTGRREGCVLVDYGAGELEITFDPRMSVSTATGQERPIAGWVSRGYHRKTAALSIAARAECELPATFQTELRLRPMRRDDGPVVGAVRTRALTAAK